MKIEGCFATGIGDEGFVEQGYGTITNCYATEVKRSWLVRLWLRLKGERIGGFK